MRKFVPILVLAFFVGISVATLEDGDLTNIDPGVFSLPILAKDGVSGGAESGLTSTQEAFLKDGDEKGATVKGMKVALVGSKAKEAYFASKEKADLPTYAAQVENYLDERLNRSGDLTVVDKLNVTEGDAA